MTAAAARVVSPALAFVVAVAGIGLFSIMDAFMKSLVLAIGVYNALVWRTGLSIAFGGVLWLREGVRRPGVAALRLHLARGIVTAAMATLFFWGLARVPMARAITLTYVAPILALLLAALVLHERVGRSVVFASAVAFGGVAVVMAGQGGGSAGWPGMAAILGSAVLYAVNLVIARAQSKIASPGEIACLQSAVVTATLLLAAPWFLAVPAGAHWPTIAVAALLATASLALLGWAYAHGPTGWLAMTEYSSFIWAAALGWLVFGERVAGPTLAGAAIIVAACLYAARRRAVAGGGLEAAA